MPPTPAASAGREPSRRVRVRQYEDASPLRVEWSLLHCVAAGGRRAIQEALSLGVVGEAFTDPVCRFGWDTLLSLERDGGAFDPVEIASAWDAEVSRRTRGGSDPRLRVGGEGFADALLRDGRHSAHPSAAESFAREILARHEFRRAQQTLAGCLETARSWEGTPEEFVAQVQREIFALRSSRDNHEHSTRSETAAWYEAHMGRYGKTDGLRGTPMGFPAIDRATRGMRPGDLVILSGLTGGGKTAFAGQVALYEALRGGSPLLFSYEMGFHDLLERHLYTLAKVDSGAYMDATLTRDQRRALDEAARTLSSIDIRVVDDFGLTLPRLIASAKRKHYEAPVSLIIVDYTQLVPLGSRESSREQEVSKIARGLKALAGDMAVPVIALSQLNEDGKVRESRGPEQDATFHVTLIPHEDQSGTFNGARRIEASLPKGRNGGRGVRVNLLFHEAQTRFEEEIAWE